MTPEDPRSNAPASNLKSAEFPAQQRGERRADYGLSETWPMDGTVAVIPAYNEAGTIANIVRRAAKFADHVIVVDDGSTDGTADALAGLPVQVLRQPGNTGKGNSLIAGLRAAVAKGASAIVTLDADGQHRPEDIPKFVEMAQEMPGKLIVGCRLADRDAVPGARYHANTIANFWISWACGYRLEDSQCGFRLYPREVVEMLADRHVRRRGFVFESEILIDAARIGIRSVAVEIPALYPDEAARSSHFKPVTDIASIVLMVAWKLISRGMYPQGLVALLRDKWSA